MSPCIWYVSKYVTEPLEDEPAGRAYGIMRELARQGYQSVIVTSDSTGNLKVPEVTERFRLVEIEGVTICRLRTFKYTRSRSVRRALSWLF